MAITEGVTRWRKLPVEIEAAQWNPGDLLQAGEVVGWLMAHGADFHHPSGMGETTTLAIKTPEGEMLARPGWWVIRGVAGEFYPCDPGVFEQTYEAASAEPSALGAAYSAAFTPAQPPPAVPDGNGYRDRDGWDGEGPW